MFSVEKNEKYALVVVNAEKLVFTSLTSGYIICEFDKKKKDS